MVIEQLLTDDVILREIGRRLARRRMDLGYTQAELAEASGVAKRTVERIEAGGSAQMSNMIRILRVLNRLDGMNHLLPETGPSPLDLLKLGGKERQRASGQRARQTNEKWSWGDDP